MNLTLILIGILSKPCSSCIYAWEIFFDKQNVQWDHRNRIYCEISQNFLQFHDPFQMRQNNCTFLQIPKFNNDYETMKHKPSIRIIAQLKMFMEFVIKLNTCWNWLNYRMYAKICNLIFFLVSTSSPISSYDNVVDFMSKLFQIGLIGVQQALFSNAVNCSRFWLEL